MANKAPAGHFTDSVCKKCWLYLSSLFTTTTATSVSAAISSKLFSDGFKKNKEKINE